MCVARYPRAHTRRDGETAARYSARVSYPLQLSRSPFSHACAASDCVASVGEAVIFVHRRARAARQTRGEPRGDA